VGAGRGKVPAAQGPEKVAVANAAVSTSKNGLGSSIFVGDGSNSGFLVLSSPMGPFLGRLDSCLRDARGDGEHEYGAQHEH
jgi:hypothetical protein